MGTALFFLLSLSLSLSLLLSPSLSRSLSPRSTTSTLDVAASLQKTTAVFSPQTQQLQSLTAAGDRAALSLSLNSRDFLPNISSNSTSAATGDYKTLTLARLRRDQARADALAARLALALSDTKRSDLKPEQTPDEEILSADALAAPVVSGSSEGSGEYFARVNIGRPPKPFSVVIDTGSDVSWIQCQPCTDCYQQSDPIFNPSSSSSFAAVACDSAPCRSLDVSACRNGSCLYQVNYGDGSFTVGDFSTETVTLDGGAAVDNVAFGCGHDNEGLFVGAAGLLGLGGGALSFPSQIQAKSFSYCLVDRDSPSSSTLDFGAGLDGAEVTAPLMRNSRIDTFYYVSLTGISVGGETLTVPASAFEMDASGGGGVIVDSGTAVTRLQSEAYEALRDAFVKGTTGLKRTEGGVALFDTCYDLSDKTSVEVPTVGLQFGGKDGELRLPAKNYLIPVDSAGTFCLAFAPTRSPLSIIGNVQQQGTRVSFDLGDSVVGFASNKC